MGEIVTIRLIEQSADRTGVEISSRASFRGTVVDYGKNHENIEALVRALGSGTPTRADVV